MNQRPSGSIVLSKALTGFLNFKSAEGLSVRTIDSYERSLKQWLEYQGDTTVSQIKSSDITKYLDWLRNDYIPHRFGNDVHQPLSSKTLRNVWVVLSSFFSWAAKEFQLSSPMSNVPAPRFVAPIVEPFTQQDLQSMLKVCAYSKEVQPGNRKSFIMRLPNAHRDQAILLFLVDTGLRAMELCSLRIKNIDLKIGKAEIKSGMIGGAKGGKGRTVYFGNTTKRALWRYLAEREDGEEIDSFVFVARGQRPFNPNSLRQLIQGIAERAEVQHAYPHRFRHTFAITYLRSGGDVFTLQALLGHGSLDMVRRYARIADLDVEKAHRKASPADNWKL